MKAKSIFIGVVTACVVALSNFTPASALVVGSFDAGNCLPFTCNNSGSATGQSTHYQQIYGASEFSGPIDIYSITFFEYPLRPGPVLNGNYDISLSTTSSALGAVYQIPGTGTQTFYNGLLGGPVAGTSFTISGSNFHYIPSLGNLLMDIIVTNQDNVASNNPAAGFLFATFNVNATTRSFAIGTFAPPASGGALALVTEFNAASVATTPLPSTWLMLLSGFLGLGYFAYRGTKKRTALAVA